MMFKTKTAVSLILIISLQCGVALCADKCSVIYFTDKSCIEKCMEVDTRILPQLKERYGEKLEVSKRDLESPANFEALMSLEKTYGIPPGDVPELFTASGAVQRTDNIRKKLTELIETELSSLGPGKHAESLDRLAVKNLTELPAGSAEVQSVAENPLKVYYFYKPGCRSCSRLDISLRYLVKKYPKQLTIFRCSIVENQAKVMNEALSIRHDKPDNLHLATPSVFFGREAFVGEKSLRGVDVVRRIVDAMGRSDREPTPEFTVDELLQAERAISGRFDRITGPAVIAAGLIDGMNPCAFVTIIFLLSYLSLLKYGKKEILLVGTSFTSAVFIAYLVIGLGFFKFADYLQSLPYLTDSVYWAGTALAATIGVLNMIDYVKISRGTVKDMALKLDDGIRMQINKVIRKNIRLGHYMVGAAVIGFSVSVLELACTGQTYLPTILFIVNTQGVASKALMMLLSYNIAFIVPLIAVFMLFFAGVSDRKFSEWLGTHARHIKLSTGIVFILLAAVLCFLK